MHPDAIYAWPAPVAYGPGTRLPIVLPPSVIVIASDFSALECMSEDKAIEVMIAEVQRYLPSVHREDIDNLCCQRHLEQPLFMNEWSPGNSAPIPPQEGRQTTDERGFGGR